MSASHFLVLALKCELFYRTDLSTIRLIMCGGSKLSINTALSIKKYLKNGCIIQVYGMSEVAGCTSAGFIENEDDTSVGQLVFGTKAKIIDDDGNRLGINESGELCTKTKFKFLGYFNNEEATNSSIDEEGYLKTGDVGYFDEQNNLFLVDRKKDLMKYCSSQISPTELEQFLIKCPSIKSVCVVGIPDDEVGDLPVAVIVQNDNETPISSDEVEQMIASKFFVSVCIPLCSTHTIFFYQKVHLISLSRWFMVLLWRCHYKLPRKSDVNFIQVRLTCENAKSFVMMINLI